MSLDKAGLATMNVCINYNECHRLRRAGGQGAGRALIEPGARLGPRAGGNRFRLLQGAMKHEESRVHAHACWQNTGVVRD